MNVIALFVDSGFGLVNPLVSPQGDSPDHEPGCDVEAIEEAKELWKALVKKGPHFVTIQMSNIAAFGKDRMG